MDIADPGRTPRFLSADVDGATFVATSREQTVAASFRMRATDLGTYLFYDAEQQYFTAEVTEDGGVSFPRVGTVLSDVLLTDDADRQPIAQTLYYTLYVNVSNTPCQSFMLPMGLLAACGPS